MNYSLLTPLATSHELTFFYQSFPLVLIIGFLLFLISYFNVDRLVLERYC